VCWLKQIKVFFLPFWHEDVYKSVKATFRMRIWREWVKVTPRLDFVAFEDAFEALLRKRPFHKFHFSRFTQIQHCHNLLILIVIIKCTKYDKKSFFLLVYFNLILLIMYLSLYTCVFMRIWTAHENDNNTTEKCNITDVTLSMICNYNPCCGLHKITI
jgi:hypothetical protein